MSTFQEPSETVAVIGAGRVGGVLIGALGQAGFDVRGPLARTDAIPASDIVLLCVPDAEITSVARKARPRTALLGHVSGATGLDDVDFSIHPLQTITGGESPEIFHGIGAAVAARTPEALAIAERMAEALGARPFDVDDAHRTSYHSAASLASNLLLVALDAAERMALTAGIRDPRELLAPLVGRTVENWTAHGAAAALTGPIARGDEETVLRQRAAVVDAAPELAELFDRLCDGARRLAREPDAGDADLPDRQRRARGKALA